MAMDTLQIVFRVLSAIVSTYMLLVIVRIMLSWFGGGAEQRLGRAGAIIEAVADPYLGFFRRITFLKIGSFDFSPVVAIIILSLVTNILNAIARAGAVSFGLVAAIVVSGIGSAITFLLGFFLVVVVVRLLGIAFRASSVRPIWFALDQMLQPVVHPVIQKIVPRATPSYVNSLLIFGTLDLGILLALDALFNLAAGALLRLPV